MPQNLVLAPRQGTLDVQRVTSYLDSQPDIVRDPLGTNTYMVCGEPEAVEHRVRQRQADPSRFPYVCLISIEPERIHLLQEMADEDELRTARSCLQWLLDGYEWNIHDDMGTELTDRIQREGIGFLYPPNL